MKKILSLLLTAVLLLTCLAGLAITTSAEESLGADVPEYGVSFAPLSVVFICNKTPISTEVGTKMYVEYTVEDSSIPANSGICSAKDPAAVWSYAQGNGTVHYAAPEDSIIVPGCSYLLEYEVVEDGFTFTLHVTDAEGNTAVYDRPLNKHAEPSGQYPYGGHVGIMAFNADSSATMKMKFYDAEGNDLGVTTNRSEVSISAPPSYVTYMVGDTDVTSQFPSSSTSYDSSLGMDATRFPVYTSEDGKTRVVEWYFDAELTNRCQGIALGSGNITLYGKLVPCTYTVIFHANGGEGTMENQSLPIGETAALTANAYTCEGKLFLGWGYFSDDETPAFTDGQEVSDLANKQDAKVNLYAIWQEVETEPETEAPTDPETPTEEPATDPVETQPETEAPTDAPADGTESDTQPEKKGCGSSVALGVASVATAMAAAVALRKKD